MKIAVITTTVEIPYALRAYRQAAGDRPVFDVRFFVAGDKHTDPEAGKFLKELGNAKFLVPAEQEQYSCSSLIGWNSVQRRNISLLEAIKWNPEIIISIDTDNFPLLPEKFFLDFARLLRQPFSGLEARAPWFDVGRLIGVSQRGIPLEQPAIPTFRPILDQRIGVAQGTCLGYPDIGSIERIQTNPWVGYISEHLRAGLAFIPAPNRRTVWNTQCLAFTKELAPAMFCPPAASGTGRYDDMLASLITQRVMRENGFAVHFGQPFVHHEHPRTVEQKLKNLQGELWGLKHLEKVASELDSVSLERGPVFQAAHLARSCWEHLERTEVVPWGAAQAALAFLDDVEKLS